METSLSGYENSQGFFRDADRLEIQIMLLREEGLSEFDNSRDLSGEFSSDGEYESILAEPGQQGLSERTQLHVKGCCLGFYAGLVVVTGK